MKQISPSHLSLIIIIESKNLRIFLPNVSTKIVSNTLMYTHTYLFIALQPFLQLGGILQSSRRGLRTVERPPRKAGRRKGRTIAASSGLLRSQRIVNIAGPGMRAQESGLRPLRGHKLASSSKASVYRAPLVVGTLDTFFHDRCSWLVFLIYEAQ